MLFRVTKNLIEVPSAYHPFLRDPQPPRGHQIQYICHEPEVEAFKFSFLPHTVVDWNNLDPITVAADSLESFKRHLR